MTFVEAVREMLAGKLVNRSGMDNTFKRLDAFGYDERGFFFRSQGRSPWTKWAWVSVTCRSAFKPEDYLAEDWQVVTLATELPAEAGEAAVTRRTPV